MSIFNFGSCNIDYVYTLQHFVSAGETIAAQHLSEHAGGKGLNQSIAAARAGGRVYHIGNIGEDGRFLQEMLAECKVNTKFLRIVEERTGHAIIQLDQAGENCIIVYPGANGCMCREQVDDALGECGRGDLCMLQNETPCADYIIRAAHDKGLIVVWNPSPLNDAVQSDSIELCDYILINRSEGKALTGEDSAEKILKELNRRYPHTAVVLTLGGEGSVYRCGETVFRQAAFAAKPVDTTGAGDTFTGYFAAAISVGQDIPMALAYASAAAAISTETLGASNSIPWFNVVRQRMEC